MMACRAGFARTKIVRCCRGIVPLPVQRHVASGVRCKASKTTSSRSKTSSRSEDGTTSTKQQQPLTSNLSSKPVQSNKSLQERFDDIGERIGSLFNFLVPKQEGDFGDVMMMSLSMAVLIYFSMQLYRLYAYAYFHAGSFSTMMDMTR